MNSMVSPSVRCLSLSRDFDGGVRAPAPAADAESHVPVELFGLVAYLDGRVLLLRNLAGNGDCVSEPLDHLTADVARQRGQCVALHGLSPTEAGWGGAE